MKRVNPRCRGPFFYPLVRGTCMYNDELMADTAIRGGCSETNEGDYHIGVRLSVNTLRMRHSHETYQPAPVAAQQLLPRPAWR
jgi:hypothetical protein